MVASNWIPCGLGIMQSGHALRLITESKLEMRKWLGNGSNLGKIHGMSVWLAAHAPSGIDPDKIAQRIFVVAYTQLDEFEVRTNLKAWLLAIAR